MKGLIRFGKQEFTAGILGTESEIQNTWLWSWAHTESGLPERSTAISRRAKRNLPDLPEFQTGKFMLDELHNGHNLAMISVGASPDNVCYYRCPTKNSCGSISRSSADSTAITGSSPPDFCTRTEPRSRLTNPPSRLNSAQGRFG